MPRVIFPTVAHTPIITSLKQISPTSVRVNWTNASEVATTGYIVHYSDGTTNKTKGISASSTSTDIIGLTIGATYTISVEATSQHLSGESETMIILLCK